MQGFWREQGLTAEINRGLFGSKALGVANNVHYIFPQGYGPRGSFATFTELAPNLRSRDLIILGGVLREQAVTPQDVFDVTIIGAANRPRQSTDGGVPTGGGASWLSPTTPVATTPLLKIREQGWKIANIQFAPVATSACVRLSRAEIASDMDGSHAEFIGCYFVGGGANGIGIEDVGGCSFVLIDDCRFQQLGDTALKGISTGIDVPQGWIIKNSQFRANLNDIKMSLNFALINKNTFFTAGSGATNKVISTTAVSVQGGNNQILLNHFNNTEVQIAPGSGFTGAATDVWMNYVTDQAALAIGQPA